MIITNMRLKQNEISELDDLPSSSMANLFKLETDGDSRYFYDYTDAIHIETDGMDPKFYVKYNIKSGDSFYSIARAFYDTYKLWWVIAVANDIDDPFVISEMVGEEILVLKAYIVSQVLDEVESA